MAPLGSMASNSWLKPDRRVSASPIFSKEKPIGGRSSHRMEEAAIDSLNHASADSNHARIVDSEGSKTQPLQSPSHLQGSPTRRWRP